MEEKKEKKLITLVKGMVPQTANKETLEDVVLALVEVVNKQAVALQEKPQAAAGGSEEIMAGIKRIEDSLKQVKEQFATMRQYGIGMAGQTK